MTDSEEAQSASGLFLHQPWLKEVTCDQAIDVTHTDDKGMRFQPRLGRKQLQDYLDNLKVFKPIGWPDFAPGC